MAVASGVPAFHTASEALLAAAIVAPLDAR
jgi:hypothetical protein